MNRRIRPYGRFYATYSGEGIQLDPDKAEAFIIGKLYGLQFPPEMVQRIREMLIQRMSDDRLAQLNARVSDTDQGLSILGGMIGLMRPETQTRNIHRICTGLELNDEGEAVGISVKPWMSQASAEVASAIEALTAQTLPKVGIHNKICMQGIAQPLKRWANVQAFAE